MTCLIQNFDRPAEIRAIPDKHSLCPILNFLRFNVVLFSLFLDGMGGGVGVGIGGSGLQGALTKSQQCSRFSCTISYGVLSYHKFPG